MARGDKKQKWCLYHRELKMDIQISCQKPGGSGGKLEVRDPWVLVYITGQEKTYRTCKDLSSDVDFTCITTGKKLKEKEASVVAKGEVLDGDIFIQPPLDVRKCVEAQPKNAEPISKAIGYLGTEGLTFISQITSALCHPQDDGNYIAGGIELRVSSIDLIEEVKMGILDGWSLFGGSSDPCEARCKRKEKIVYFAPKQDQEGGKDYNKIIGMINGGPLSVVCAALDAMKDCLGTSEGDVKKLQKCFDKMTKIPSLFMTAMLACWAAQVLNGSCNVTELAINELKKCLCAQDKK